MTFLLLRRPGGLALLVALLALASAAPAAAQSLGDLDGHSLGNYDVVVGPNGSAVCEALTPDQARRRGAPTAPVNLTVLPSLNPPDNLGGLRIILRATDQLLERPDALLAFRRAAARWERAIRTPITVVYDIDYGPLRFGVDSYAPNTIASANSASDFARGGDNNPVSVAAVIDRMKARATDDAQLTALYNAIPVPTPNTTALTNGTKLPVTVIYGGQPTLQMLGYLPALLDPSPTVTPFGGVPNLGFNSRFNFDFEPNDGNDPALIDFESIVIHEMGHSLGFTSAIGFALQQPTGGTPFVLATPWDLFRVRPDSVVQNESFADGKGWETTPRVLTPGPPETVTFMQGTATFFKAVQVFYDGLHEYETSTATGGRTGGDGQQASHWRDDALRPPTPQDDADRYIGVMDPNFGNGVRQLYKYTDLRVLEVIGYDINFSPTYAGGLGISIDGNAVRIDTLAAAPIQLGDVAVGAQRSVVVEVSNPGLQNRLDFDIEILRDAVYPEGVAVTASFGAAEGTVSPGGSQTLTLTIGNASEPATFAGRLRFRTNFDSLLVVEIPIEFSVGGATEPMLALSGVPENGDYGNLGDLGPDDTRTITFGVANTGSLPLRYEVLTQLSPRTFDFDTTPSGAARGVAGRSPLAAFFGARAAAATVLYQFDFEDQARFDALAKGGSAPGDWQLVSGGAAALGGHSPTKAAYFGQITPSGSGDVYQYQDNASGQLLLPAIDLSGVSPADLATVSFNYYLKAEEGFDFAALLYSVDGGLTFETATTSDQGLLVNTTTGWKSVMVDITAISGLADPVVFAFQFTSDGGVTDEGWYVDDVLVSVLEDVNPFYASPNRGVLSGMASPTTITVTASGAALEPGFYDGVVSVVTNQRADDPAPLVVEFSAGNPRVPTLVPATASISTTIPKSQISQQDVVVSNAGAAPLTYVRVLQPALGQYDDIPPAARPQTAPGLVSVPADGAATEVDVTKGAPEGGRLERSASAEAGTLASIALPTTFAIGITQLPDGRVLVTDAGNGVATPKTYILSEDLSAIQTLNGATPANQQILGVVYNERTESLWYAGFGSGLLYEVRLSGSTLTRTSRTIRTGFAATSMTYSRALDAFLIIPYQSDLVYAFDVSGNQLPGYPKSYFRGSSYAGISMTGGVLEIGYLDLFNSPANDQQISFIQYDQFVNLFPGFQVVRFDDPDVTAARSVRGFIRSRTNPAGAMYLLTRGATGLQAKVVSIDPPDLPASTQTFIDALTPAYGNDLAPQAQASLSFRLRPVGESGTVVRDTLAFITNSPTDRIVTIPVEVSITGGTATEAGAPATFAFRGTSPNPLRGEGQVQFDLPEAATVTVSVFNVLGQRVAVLASDEPMPAGTHALPFSARAFAAGVYVVRLDAGTFAGTQKVTVVR